jgi:hypothetical protein
MDNSSGASPGRLIDEDESDILESAIDLFSLLSFVLIAAASLFGAAESQRQQTYSSVLSFDRVVQSDQVPTVPRGAVVVVLSGADSRVELRLRSADAQAKVLWSGSRLDALCQALEDELETFVNAETVALTLADPDDPASALKLRAFYEIEAWFTEKHVDANVFLE